MEMAGEDVVRVNWKDKVMMAICSWNKVSVLLPCLLDCFDIELFGTELDDSISPWAYERVAVGSLIDIQSNRHSLHEEFCVFQTIRSGAAFRCEVWFTHFPLLERGGDLLIEEVLDQFVLMFFPALWKSQACVDIYVRSHIANASIIVLLMLKETVKVQIPRTMQLLESHCGLRKVALAGRAVG